MSNPKKILVVEDAGRWKTTITQFCQRAHQKLYGSDPEIIYASTLAEAKQVLSEHDKIHFASVDLNLEGDAVGTTDPGGLHILKEIHDRGLDTVSIVVSGEMNMHFPAISKKYGVLTYQQKDNPSFPQTFMTAVEAALLYTEAKELFDEERYRAALEKWRQAKKVVTPIETRFDAASDWSFPMDIEVAYQKRFRHPVTHLPTGELIDDELRQVLSSEQWWVAYLKIEGLQHFIKSEGNQQARVLISVTRDLIEKHLIDQSGQQIFLGQATDHTFVIVSQIPPTDEQLAAAITSLKTAFDTSSLRHYSIQHLTNDNKMVKYKDSQGQTQEVPVATLSVRFATGQNNEFQVGRLTETGQIAYDAPEFGTFDVIDEVLRQRY